MSNIAQQLAELKFFNEKILTQHESLLHSVIHSVYQPGDTLFHHHEECNLVHVVSRGLIKLLSFLPNGRTRIVRLHRPGSVLGLSGLMKKDYEHTAVAIDEVEVFKIPLTELSQWKESEADLYSQLLEKWYEYLNQADTWITDFSTGSVKGRVARLVRFLARFDTGTGPSIVELLTTEEMAEILGVTPESVSRTVAEFKRDGLLEAIENNQESLFTFDREKLSDIAKS